MKKKLLIVLVVVATLVMTFATVPKASAVDLELPSGRSICDLPDGAANALRSGKVVAFTCTPGGGV